MPQVSFYNIYFHFKKNKTKQNLQRSLAVLNFFVFSFVSTAQIFDTQCRWCHQGHQTADHEGPRCSGELIILKNWMEKWPQTVNVHLLLLLEKNPYNVDCEALRCLCLGHGGHTSDCRPSVTHLVWCFRCSASPSHFSCAKLKKLLILSDSSFVEIWVPSPVQFHIDSFPLALT